MMKYWLIIAISFLLGCGSKKEANPAKAPVVQSPTTNSGKKAPKTNQIGESDEPTEVGTSNNKDEKKPKNNPEGFGTLKLYGGRYFLKTKTFVHGELVATTKIKNVDYNPDLVIKGEDEFINCTIPTMTAEKWGVDLADLSARLVQKNNIIVHCWKSGQYPKEDAWKLPAKGLDLVVEEEGKETIGPFVPGGE